MTFKELAQACLWFWIACAFLGCNVGYGLVSAVQGNYWLLAAHFVAAVMSAIWVAQANKDSSRLIAEFYERQLAQE